MINGGFLYYVQDLQGYEHGSFDTQAGAQFYANYIGGGKVTSRRAFTDSGELPTFEYLHDC